MKLKIDFIEDNNLEKDEYEILIKASKKNENANSLISYINNFIEKKISVTKNNEIIEIKYADIILFYSDKNLIIVGLNRESSKLKASYMN